MSDPLFLGLWALVLFGSWSFALWNHVRGWRARRPDARSRRSVMSVFLGWLTAALFAGALATSLVADVTDVGFTLRGAMFGLGLGVFAASGINAAIESRRR